MARPFIPLYVSDYIGDTMHLTTEQHGAYLLLIFHYWATGGLPDDDAQLARITGLPPERWRRHKPVIHKFFYDGWKHKRIDQELKRCADIRAKRQRAGEKGNLVLAMERFRKNPKR